jgi:hypothetical protein
MTTKINSNAFYTILMTNFALARDEIKLATDEDVTFFIFSVHSYKGPQNPQITIKNDKYGDEKIEVEGSSLSDLVDEFIRRKKFSNAQANLRLGPPQIEGEIS